MIRATGGSACDATSTRSRPLLNAYCFASDVDLMPSCEPSSSISRTCDARMLSLIRACGTGLDGGSIVRLGLKEQSPSSLHPFFERQKPLQAAAQILVFPTRLNHAELKRSRGEERGRSCLADLRG